MPSPFPGMDPYLEDPIGWGGVHLGMIYAIQAALNRDLPEGFFAEIDQYVRVDVESEEGEFGRRNPDVFVPERTGKLRRTRSTGSVAVLDPPTAEVTLLPGKILRHRRVLIRTAEGREVVTAVEILSPINKSPGPGRDSYVAKRSEYLASGTSLVEIDLLRDGDRLALGKPRPPLSDYYIVVSPADKRPHSSVWTFSVQQPIPIIPVPLSAGTVPVPLNLRACLDRIYDEGRYASKLNYSLTPIPPLREPDARWAQELLRKNRISTKAAKR